MRIGLDFDNTIACYDGVFHAAALDRGLIPTTLPHDKNSVRDHLNASGRKDAFTELQGYVYGARMDLVQPYSGVRDFVVAARDAGHELFIISHKTPFPLLGPRYDLHAAARGFLEARGFTGRDGVIGNEDTFFEATKEEKVARGKALGIDLFVDDLPDVLAMAGWAEKTRKILFDPDDHFPDGMWRDHRFERALDWAGLRRVVLPG